MDRAAPPENFVTGQASRVTHKDFGSGVILEQPRDGYVRVFFSSGEKRVPLSSLEEEESRAHRILASVSGTREQAVSAFLTYEAHAIPLMDNAAALTAAKIDLLPHQVVLTHRMASASPRRFLIADEVGLGKTIETALVLRELASRGELRRALMVVPAGLVNNWHRELNEVFNLDFEIFGSEGDITDRKSNAFAKHDRLIASIDTLKRPARLRRLQEAPRWDLVVFDEAHHLTAYKSGGKVHKTENYKLAEILKGHSRDLFLLSATPHQGNHFQFWMLIQLLDPTLFAGPEDMIENRHRLNTVVFRRTKADACRPDGSPLFARRWVHTESFLMNAEEVVFYDKLRAYLEEGFNLSRRQGNKGRGLGFLMAIFQKIAASSFSAVGRTLRRRLIMLTLHEALLRDKELDIEGREKLIAETRCLVHAEHKIATDAVGKSEVDRVIAELKFRLVKKLDEEELEMASDPYGSEYASAHAEDAAADIVNIHLPEERLRIQDVLASFPSPRETKAQKLLDGLGVLWRQNPREKIVIFTTYLGTVDLIEKEIEAVYPGQGVVVLRGGDHGSKLAAERRFRRDDGPRVMVCTAAGREGINLQFAHILFNFDLPWNPMDVEQRIGRIHRYKQEQTAQVYNLVLSDTIEGRIFLLLEEKLEAIASTLGKVDEEGNIAEDMRSQILGQLSERLNYDKLYQEALSDPELKRTKVELEAALSNAREAREVVFNLFQDLQGFSLDEYQPFSDITHGVQRIARFYELALGRQGSKFVQTGPEAWQLLDQHGGVIENYTSNRDTAAASDEFSLIGMDHPRIAREIARWVDCPTDAIGLRVRIKSQESAILSLWQVEMTAAKGERKTFIVPIALSLQGLRLPFLEKKLEEVLTAPIVPERRSSIQHETFLKEHVEPALFRELSQRGRSQDNASYSTKLIGWVEIVD
jgi:superfamily II DNA or RNA helicase